MLETSATSAQDDPLKSAPPENSLAGQSAQKESLTKTNRGGPKPRNKNDDIPFPVVYIGFIAAFLMARGDVVWESFPSYKYYMASSFMPEPASMVLPAISFFVVCPVLFMWRKLVKGMFFAWLAENWAGLPCGTVTHEKFCEQAWLAVHYTLATTLGFVALRETSWFPPIVTEDAQVALLATSEERENDQKNFGIQVYYGMQLGFYALELITLLTSKNRRSDAVVYFFHHIYTLYLMSVSWVSFNHRIGTIVLFLHDIGDIFLPIGKCYTYAEAYIRKTKTKAQYETHKAIGMASFVMFVIMFAVPRLLFYGALIYQGFTKYSWYRCCGYDVVTQVCNPCTGVKGAIHTAPLFIVLGLLYPMHVYWFYLIVKMALRLVLQPGEYNDVRSDDEKED